MSIEELKEAVLDIVHGAVGNGLIADNLTKALDELASRRAHLDSCPKCGDCSMDGMGESSNAERFG